MGVRSPVVVSLSHGSHATFTRTDGQYVVSDLGSLNGSYVNRDRIDTDVVLSGGDEVQIGKYRLIYFSGSPRETE